MKILAIESSAKAASCALCTDGVLTAQYTQCCGLTHSRTLLSMVEAMLQNLEMTVEDVDVIAVAHGPGSFTGIRIGVAAAKGLAWGADKPGIGVSTLEAMAWHLADREGALVCPVMDARRGQVYNAVFRIEGGRPVRLRPDRAIALSVLLDEMQAADAPCYLVGDGAALCEAAFAQAGLKTLPVPAPLRMQSAWGVAMAAADKTPGDAADLTPNYLRLSQAERERLERLQKDAQE